MSELSKVSIILPSYNPPEGILTVIGNVLKQGFCDVIVVNDGSRSELLHIFDEAAKIEGCTVVAHEVNMGKGAALKTGMTYFLENRPNGTGVVTIDDDGQHLPDDIKRCAEAMVKTNAMILGARDFNKPDVPPKSRFGNKAMALIFRLGVGLRITDTQTGLRAIPGKYIPAFLDVDGNRFEYETNMLIAAKKNKMEISEVTINTIYIEGNKATHFRAFKDSFSILYQFVKYAIGAALSFGIDILMFYLLLSFLSGGFHPDSRMLILLSTILARIVSSTFNFFFNKGVVFKHKGKDIKSAALRYLLVCLLTLTLSSLLVSSIAELPLITTASAITLVKALVDTVLFIMNYFIQKKWVYK